MQVRRGLHRVYPFSRGGDGGVLWIAGAKPSGDKLIGSLLVSQDDGVTWVEAFSRVPIFTDVAFSKNGIGIITTSTGPLFASRDGGATWLPDSANVASTHRAVFASQRAFVIGGSVVYSMNVDHEASSPQTHEGASASLIHVYPNPSTSDFTIQLPHSLNSPLSISLFDNLGRQRSGWQLESVPVDNRIMLRGDGIPPGVYHLRVDTATESFSHLIHRMSQ